MVATWKAITYGPAANTADNIPLWDGANANVLKDGLALVTTVGSTGADTSVPSEQAVREAITTAQIKKASIIIGDGTNAITTGIKAGFECPIAGHITAARVHSLDATSGAIAIAVWIEPYAGGVPADADEVDIFSIAASGTQSEETGLTIDVAVGDIITLNVDSVTSMKLIALTLTIEVV
jgi:hypothetical protein